MPEKPKPSPVMDQIFKAYDIRGTYPEPLNEDVAWKVGHASASFLRSLLTGYSRSEQSANRLVVGCDARQSSPALTDALVTGISSTNTETIDIGLCDTPMIYFAINHLGTCGGVQVTASHNPAQYNGFKISGQKARPIGQDTGLWELKRIAEAIAIHKVTVGATRHREDLWGPYRDFLRGFMDEGLRPLRVVVDASNGSAGKMVPAVFDDLPVEIVPLNFAPLGEFRHEPNPMLESSLRELRRAVVAEKAHFGVCFDGDADRCVFVDQTGRPVHSDLITALLVPVFLAREPGSTVVYDVRTSRVVVEEITRAGGVPRRERVGHAYIKKALSEANGVFAGEGSGHFYFKDYFFADSGAMVFIQMLNLLSRRNVPLSQLLKPLSRYASSGELNFRNEKKDETIDKLAERYGQGEIDRQDGIRIDFDDWWFNVRKSNTEPLLRLNAEAATQKLLEEKLAELTPLLGKPETH
ncbi:MAG: Phosphomannomutase/phosphoglucomutase [Phycisphaerae bacterium]|nr:Phosphomannomutase/phosphoglucomutase [Phycisphaerae bacterium]